MQFLLRISLWDVNWKYGGGAKILTLFPVWRRYAPLESEMWNVWREVVKNITTNSFWNLVYNSVTTATTTVSDI
jgi:hypothetical protein